MKYWEIIADNLLEKGWPLEYGDRRLLQVETEPTPATLMPPMTLVLSMPDGEKRPIDFKEAEKIFCGHFPRRDTYKPPTEEGNSSPAPESDLDGRRSNGN